MKIKFNRRYIINVYKTKKYINKYKAIEEKQTENH